LRLQTSHTVFKKKCTIKKLFFILKTYQSPYESYQVFKTEAPYTCRDLCWLGKIKENAAMFPVTTSADRSFSFCSLFLVLSTNAFYGLFKGTVRPYKIGLRAVLLEWLRQECKIWDAFHRSLNKFSVVPAFLQFGWYGPMD
jgi:hypothetical protein